MEKLTKLFWALWYVMVVSVIVGCVCSFVSLADATTTGYYKNRVVDRYGTGQYNRIVQLRLLSDTTTTNYTDTTDSDGEFEVDSMLAGEYVVYVDSVRYWQFIFTTDITKSATFGTDSTDTAYFNGAVVFQSGSTPISLADSSRAAGTASYSDSTGAIVSGFVPDSAVDAATAVLADSAGGSIRAAVAGSAAVVNSSFVPDSSATAAASVTATLADSAGGAVRAETADSAAVVDAAFVPDSSVSAATAVLADSAAGAIRAVVAGSSVVVNAAFVPDSAKDAATAVLSDSSGGAARLGGEGENAYAKYASIGTFTAKQTFDSTITTFQDVQKSEFDTIGGSNNSIYVGFDTVKANVFSNASGNVSFYNTGNTKFEHTSSGGIFEIEYEGDVVIEALESGNVGNNDNVLIASFDTTVIQGKAHIETLAVDKLTASSFVPDSSVNAATAVLADSSIRSASSVLADSTSGGAIRSVTSQISDSAAVVDAAFVPDSSVTAATAVIADSANASATAVLADSAGGSIRLGGEDETKYAKLADNETVSGIYTFSNKISGVIDSSNASATAVLADSTTGGAVRAATATLADSAGGAVRLGGEDETKYAKLADNETITGDWIIDGTTLICSTLITRFVGNGIMSLVDGYDISVSGGRVGGLRGGFDTLESYLSTADIGYLSGNDIEFVDTVQGRHAVFDTIYGYGILTGVIDSSAASATADLADSAGGAIRSDVSDSAAVVDAAFVPDSSAKAAQSVSADTSRASIYSDSLGDYGPAQVFVLSENENVSGVPTFGDSIKVSNMVKTKDITIAGVLKSSSDTALTLSSDDVTVKDDLTVGDVATITDSVYSLKAKIEFGYIDTVYADSVYSDNIAAPLAHIDTIYSVDTIYVDRAGASYIRTDTIRADVIIADSVIDNGSPHLYCGFVDSSVTISLDQYDTAQVTNTQGNLWICPEYVGFPSLNGDTLQVLRPGDYIANGFIRFNGETSTSYRLGIYNVTQGEIEGFYVPITTSGVAATNVLAAINIYLDNLSSNDKMIFFITNMTDGDDPVVVAANIILTFFDNGL